jgi:hypothetical protein
VNRDTSALSKFTAACHALDTVLGRLTRSGETDDREMARTIGAEQRSYLLWSKRSFAAIDAGDLRQARSIGAHHVAPTLDAMESRVRLASAEGRNMARRGFISLNLREEFVALGSLIFFTLAFLALALFWWVLRVYRRRVDEEREAERRRLELAALTDSITGLGNHRAFQEELRSAA